MSVKPLARWAIMQQWTLRYTERGDRIVSGIFNTPDGSLPFRYERESRIVYLPTQAIQLDEHGWQLNPTGRTTFHSTREEHSVRNDQLKDATDDEI